MNSQSTSWRRDKAGLGVWEHRGKVAVAGVGHSYMDRRWDGKSFDMTLGAYSIDAARKAIADAGLSPNDIDGVISNPGPMGERWAPRAYFAPPYDSEDGLTLVTAEWLVKEMGLKNVKYINSNVPQIGEEMGFAAQAVGDGVCKNLLVLYPTGNIEGRYHHGGENAGDYAKGLMQWQMPWGYHPGALMRMTMMFKLYCRQYGKSTNGLAPYAVNARRNGLLTPWSYYALHEKFQITEEDYLTSRWIHEPLRLLDCDRPVQASACWLFTSAERARDMRQKPVYVLNHSQVDRWGWKYYRGLMPTLEETESFSALAAQFMWEGSGLGPKDIDIFNPYDGYLTFTQFFLEAFQWHGVKKGEAMDFYKGDIRVEGPNPYVSSGGNIGTGRTRTALFTDSIEQLRGTAGKRQVRVRAETALAGCNAPDGNGFILFSNKPS